MRSNINIITAKVNIFIIIINIIIIISRNRKITKQYQLYTLK